MKRTDRKLLITFLLTIIAWLCLLVCMFFDGAITKTTQLKQKDITIQQLKEEIVYLNNFMDRHWMIKKPVQGKQPVDLNTRNRI